MQNKILIALITISATITSITSCGTYHKILKSQDPVEQYNAANNYYAEKKYSKAAAIYELAMETLIGTEYEDTILFRMGKLNFETKSYYNSSEIMNQYRNKFPTSPNTPEAEYLHAMSYYYMSGDVEKDQEYTRKAIIALNEYINRYPNSTFAPEIQTLIEELYRKIYYKKYLNAALYHKIGQHLAAITSLRAILKTTPETPYRQDIMYLICKSWFDYAKNSIYSKQLDRYLKTIDAYYSFKTAFPDSKQFDRELERMKEIAEDFVEKNGVTAQAIENSATKIADAKETIAKAKDDMFDTKGKENKKALRTKIKNARETIKTERKKSRIEEKTVRENEKTKLKEVKEKEKQEDRELKKKQQQQKK